LTVAAAEAAATCGYPVHKWISGSGYCGVNGLLHYIWDLLTELSTGNVDNLTIFVDKPVDKWKT
jgi:hypothetical protein